jgi:type III secretory pathway component EscS
MLMQFLFRKKILLISLPILMMCSVIFITSLLQAMTEYGDSMRYALPVRGLVICVVVSEAWWIRGQINLLEKHPR